MFFEERCASAPDEEKDGWTSQLPYRRLRNLRTIQMPRPEVLDQIKEAEDEADEIIAEAEQAAEGRVAEAREEADDIRQSAREEADDIAKDRLSDSRKEIEAEREEILEEGNEQREALEE